MYYHTCFIHGVWLNGCLCNCNIALEISKCYHDLFPDRYDDSGTLRIDSFVYSVFENWFEQHFDGYYYSLHNILFTNHYIYSGRLFPAACIDGCSVYRMFTHVAVPLAKTGFMVTGLMSFVANWNELLLAMVFISKEAKKTLPVSLTKFVGPYNTNYCQMFAAIVLAIIPTVVVYCCFANNIVDGLTQGAVKG